MITASSAMEYAFADDRLTDDRRPSVFTSALVEALVTRRRLDSGDSRGARHVGSGSRCSSPGDTASVSDTERSELNHRVRMDPLARAAAAMNCDLVYAFVPRGPLTGMVEQRANGKIEDEARAVSRSVVLEAQATEVGERVIIEQMQALIGSGRLWK